MNYLNRRVTQILGVNEIDTKSLSLNMLMTAYTNRVNNSGIDQGITAKVSGLAKHYANILMEGKFVVFRGEEDNRTYYVVARERDLVAVFHPIGTGFDIYAAYGTSDQVLHNCGITTMSFTDHDILDNLFNWGPEKKHLNKDKEEVVSADIHPGGPLAWHWHQPVPDVKVDSSHTEPTGAEKKLTEVKIPASFVEPAGAPASEDRRVEMTTTGATTPTVMEQSFNKAKNQQQGQGQGHHKHQDRRVNPRPETSKS